MERGRNMTKPRRNRSSQDKKARPRNKTLLRYGIAIVVILVILGGAALLFTPQQTPFVPEVLGAPRVAVAQDVIDFGDVVVNHPVEAVFHVRNVGDGVLHLLDQEPPVELVEGC